MPTATPRRGGATHPSEYPANNPRLQPSHDRVKVRASGRSGRAGRTETHAHAHAHAHAQTQPDGRTGGTQALRQYSSSTIEYPTGTQTNADGRAGGRARMAADLADEQHEVAVAANPPDSQRNQQPQRARGTLRLERGIHSVLIQLVAVYAILQGLPTGSNRQNIAAAVAAPIAGAIFVVKELDLGCHADHGHEGGDSKHDHVPATIGACSEPANRSMAQHQQAYGISRSLTQSFCACLFIPSTKKASPTIS
jgi:hypothetical protein